MADAAQELFQDLLCQVFEINPEALLLLDMRGKVLRINSRVTELTGYVAADVVGKHAFELPFMPAESQKVVKAKFVERVKGKQVASYDVKIIAKDGRELVGSVMGKLLKNKLGLPSGVIVVVQDVTEQRATMSELRELKERTEKYLDVSTAVTVVLNSKGEIDLLNRAGLELLGYVKEEVLGRNWFELAIPEEQKSSVKEVFKQLMAGGEEEVRHYENEVLTKNNERRLISWQNSVLRGESGEVVACVSSGQDVTGQEEVRESLKEAQDMLALVMEHSGEVYYVNSTAYDRLDYVSPQCERMMGYSPEELKKDWTQILTDSPINQAAVESTKKAIASGKKQPPYLVQIRTKKGEIKTAEVDETPILDVGGKVVGLSGVVRDVSDRLKAEKELEARVEQLESVNKVVVGRELKMIELKEEISRLTKELERGRDTTQDKKKKEGE